MPQHTRTTVSRAAEPERLQAAIDLVVARLQPDQIILFGSAARDEMTAESDLDLLVIKEPEPGEPARDHAHWECENTGGDIDMILMDRASAENGRRSAGQVQGAALEEGRTVYTRGGVEPIRTGPIYRWNGREMVRTTLFEPDHAHKLLERGKRKWDIANRERIHAIDRCENVQIVIEQALKALITSQGQRVKHNHNLNDLWKDAEEQGERINATYDEDALKNLSKYAGPWRYDVPPDEDPEHTWETTKTIAEDLLNHARQRVPKLVLETNRRLEQLEGSPHLMSPSVGSAEPPGKHPVRGADRPPGGVGPSKRTRERPRRPTK